MSWFQVHIWVEELIKRPGGFQELTDKKNLTGKEQEVLKILLEFPAAAHTGYPEYSSGRLGYNTKPIMVRLRQKELLEEWS